MSDSRPGWDRALEVMCANWCRNGGDHSHNIDILKAVYPVLVEALTTQLRQQVLHEAVLAVHNARFYNPANAAMDTGYGGVREAERALYRIGALLQLPNDQHPNGYPPPSAVEGLTT